MSVCVAPAPVPSSSWAPHPRPSRALRRTSATWNSKFPAGLDLDLSLPAAAIVPTPLFFVAPGPPPKPRLRLPSLPPTTTPTPICRFDPFADDDEPPRPARLIPQENLPPSTPSRGRTLTPLTISSPLPSSSPAPSPSPTGRRRSPSFSAGSPSLSAFGARVPLPLSALSSLSTLLTLPSPAPSLSRAAPTMAAATVPGAPSPFLARHYPTPDARERLLARTLLHRIHAVGRPRSLYSCSSSSRLKNGYENECGAREYIPSRLSECVVAVC
ncbi:hypothetical protein GGX14DRAFT_429447 [Mycena pura]|uniref:Uncharacterized protein n=1 Tax=Mycena pura TaxID=153505 RepID=A0AAD6VT63_9AGAR|nr:hypothetical protein GGX14DRAFT_429447 [Mycena pura]